MTLPIRWLGRDAAPLVDSRARVALAAAVEFFTGGFRANSRAESIRPVR